VTDPAPVRPLLRLVAVLLVALNLRSAIAAVAPILGEVRADLGLTPATAGLLTTLPVLCFALLAPPSVALSRRVGLHGAILLGCGGIVLGSIVRVLDGVPVLLGATIVVGAGMTVGNVLVPVVVKAEFPRRAGHMTGLYTAALVTGASIAAALTAPLATVWGWRPALASWGLLAMVAAVVWRFAFPQPPADRATQQAEATKATSPWRSPVAWALAAFFGAQALCFYAVTAWLPTVLVDEAGLTPAAAGGGASLFQVLGIAGTLAIPAVIHRRPHQGWLAVTAAGGFMVLFVGLLLWPSGWPLWVAIGGIAQGASISLGLTLIVLRAHGVDVARRLSGMVQLVGYLIGALGPVLIGWLYGSTGAWQAPLLALLGAALAMAILGQVAGANRSVDSDPGRRMVS
jgi:CP family cyanate transporter-like MFS transporter